MGERKRECVRVRERMRKIHESFAILGGKEVCGVEENILPKFQEAIFWRDQVLGFEEDKTRK